jgi:hypothetical protein
MRNPTAAAVLWLLPLAASCGGGGDGGGGGTSDLQALIDCTDARLKVFGDVLGLLRLLADEASGIDVPDVTLTPTPAPNQYTFNALLDLDGDLVKETTAVGGIGFSADPTNGLEEGDRIAFQLTSLAGGPVSGNAAFQILVLAGNAVRLNPGMSNLGIGSNCSLAVTAVDLTGAFVEDAIPNGTVDFTLGFGTDQLSATLSLDGTTTASVEGTLNGSLPVQFDISLD